MLSKERGKYFQEQYDELQYRFANYELNKKCEQLQQENQQLKENYDRIYNENCKLREEHNITDISLLDENQQLKKAFDKIKDYVYKVETFATVDKVYIFSMKNFKEILEEVGEIE